MKHDALKEALQRRKGSNVDITLVIGGDEKHDDKGDNKELAPEVKDAGGENGFDPQAGSNPDQSQDIEMIKNMMGGDEEASGHQGPPSLKSRAHALMKDKLLKK